MRINLGTVAKPQGVKGEIKVNPLSDAALRFLNLKKVFIGGTEYEITACSVRDNGVFLKLKGIDDRNAVEPLRNMPVDADKDDIGELDNDEYFIDDLIGLKIKMNDVFVGELKDVQSYGSADVFSAVINGAEVMFPFIGEVVTDVNINEGFLTVSEQGMARHAVYED